MDPSSPVSKNRYGSTETSPPAPPSQTPLMTAIRQITELSRGKTTVEQLAALSYAWGGQESQHTPGYAASFEKCKATFLEKDKSTNRVEARTRFNKLVRDAIRAQLPSNLGRVLEKVQQDCEQRQKDIAPADAYTEMKKEVVTVINRLRASLITHTIETAPQPGIDQPYTTTASTGGSLPLPTSTAVTPLPAQAAAFLPVSPLNAPVHLAFLNTFPAEWRSRPAWAGVIASMDTYLTSFGPYRGDAQRKLLQSHPAEVVKAVDSIALHTRLDADEARKVAYQREIVNIAMGKHFNQDTNQEILGCKTSRMMESEVARTPGNQLSLSMRVPIRTVDDRVCRPVILSVPAPALDIPTQPEWNQYVKDGTFDAAAYETSFEALAAHIKECAARPENKGHEVILSGFGLTNFLAALPQADKVAAVGIGAKVMTQLILDLRKQGVDVAYTDYSGSSPPWPIVNAALGKDKIQCRGRIPGTWIKDEQIIVNAWDPHSLVGNGCANDNSLDGFIGRSSLVHETHALACMLHANGFLS